MGCRKIEKAKMEEDRERDIDGFCVWLIAFRRVCLTFIHAAAWIKISLTFVYHIAHIFSLGEKINHIVYELLLLPPLDNYE